MQAEVIDSDFTVGVAFRNQSRAENYRCNHLRLKVGDMCVVDTESGPNIGYVSRSRMKLIGFKHSGRLRNVIRKATTIDLDLYEDLAKQEKAIFLSVRDRVDNSKLKMKVSRVDIPYGGKRAVIFFTADSRVDFRDMVKALAAEFSIKVEMRQYGIRDEAKQCGGLGLCGSSLCCTTFLHDFVPVSIKMAKDQGLSLNPAKISGVCGRLMCCLNYENEFYKEMQKIVPRVGRSVITPNGRGKVIAADYFKKRVTVYLPNGDREKFEVADIKTVHQEQQEQQRKRSPDGKTSADGKPQREGSSRNDNRGRGHEGTGKTSATAVDGREASEQDGDRPKKRKRRRRRGGSGTGQAGGNNQGGGSNSTGGSSPSGGQA